jgi:hypothetical protein
MYKTLIVYGDLRTHFGYSRALRDHLYIFSKFFDYVFGVDIHYHPKFSRENFSFPILTEEEALVALDVIKGKKVILNYTTPDNFRYNEKAFNIGYFYWETDRFNNELGWEKNILKMDAMIVPVNFMIKNLINIGYKNKIMTIPWPYLNNPKKNINKDLKIDVFSNNINNFIKNVKISDITKIYDNTFLWIGQNIPRKGLPILLSEWLNYKKKYKLNDCLIIKLSTFDPNIDYNNLILEVNHIIHTMKLRNEIDISDIFLYAGILSDKEMQTLISLSDALISTSLGEGFGGPVVEAIKLGKLVLTHRGTSFETLIPSNYKFSLDFSYEVLSLVNLLPVYSKSSKWALIREGALSENLFNFHFTSEEERKKLNVLLNKHISKVLDVVKIEKKFGDLIKGYLC